VFKGGGGSSPEIAEVLLSPGGARFSYLIEVRMVTSAVRSSSDGSRCGAVVVGGSVVYGGINSLISFIVSEVSGGPLSEDLGIEESPDLLLSFKHTGMGASWAVVDWHTGSKGLVEVLVVPASLEDEDDDHDVKDGKSDKDETEHLSTSESGDETSMAGISASVGNSGVGIDSDSHSNVTGNDGGR